MSFEKINPESLGKPHGYNNGILGPAGSRVLFVAGQIGWLSAGGAIPQEFIDQFANALDNVIAVVVDAGGSPQNIARMVIYVTDKTEYKSQRREIGKRWRKAMGTHYPAIALVEVKSLLEDDAKVEIEAIALLDDINPSRAS